ncbi:MAG TPA: FAD-dependent oxidoreductase [Candidatus Bathyarchaeia archaeon]|nr:FAD-dependent oxidoreductase [Candidatus Bathyarchaeia archaeon]
MPDTIYDLIIIGAGPAGLAASIYASRYRINHLVIGKEPGGQAVEAHKVENWPGTKSISGFELTQNMREHAAGLGAEIVMDSISNISRGGDFFDVTAHTAQYKTKNIILALGMEYKKLSIPGEEEFKGRGVSYCPTCDAAFFGGKIVAVVGGGNSAASAAQLLAQYASKVYVIYRGEKLKVDPAYLENFSKNEKIEIIYNTNVREIKGNSNVERIILDKKYNDKDDLEVQGVFIEIGSEPGVELVKQLGVEADDQGFIIVNPDQSTNVAGIYAAGDATTGSNKLRQILTAAAEGAVAAASVYKKIQIS